MTAPSNVTGPVVEWVFRHCGGCIIDLPDLPTPPANPAWRWVATRWPEPIQDTEWEALMWHPGERGFLLPDTLAIGDVLEFGITCTGADGQLDLAHTSRWYGWLDHATDYGLIVRGPYPDHLAAAAAARPAIDEIRIAQLDPPTAALMEPTWNQTAP